MDINHVRRGAVRRLAAALVCAVALIPAPAAIANNDAVMARNAGVGLASGLASLVYMPVKTFYALGGFVVGGLAYAFSGGDADVARVVLEPSVMGDYVITTEHLSGGRKVQFFGRHEQTPDGFDRRYEVEDRDVASAPEGW